MKKIYIALGFAAMSFAACKPDLRSEAPTANGLDFTNYIAIGNSLTAGYADGSLYRSGQINSYPAILAQQFSTFGKIVFKQPLLPGETGWPAAKRVLGHTTDCAGTASIAPYSYNGARDTNGSATSVAIAGPYNNMGVPGIRAVDYVTPAYALGAALYGGAPWALRFFTNPLGRPLDEVKGRPVTFFTMWLGANDVLGYALSGGEGNPNATHPSNISDLNAFKVAYDSVVTAMTANGAKGALLNIPDVTTIPYFTTIPANGLVLDATNATNLNAAYAGTGITFTTGPNYFVVEDPNAPFGFRKAVPGELLVLTTPTDSLKCYGWGSVKPIPKKYVLSLEEVGKIKTATDAFNSYIQSSAISHGLAYVNMNAYLKTVQTGIKYNGISYSAAFVSGGAFSLDGIHLTPRGYALVANEILRVVNGYYGSTIPMADPGKYDGIKFP